MDDKNKNEKKDKPKSFLDTVREIEEQDRKREIEAESKRMAEQAQREQEERKAYEEKLRQERLELIKLKQGIINEDDIQTEAAVKKQYSVLEKIGNFFYHNKAYIIVGGLFAALAFFLIYDFARTERPDIKALYIAADYDMSYYSSEITPFWNDCTEDYNGDKEKLARLYYVPTGYADDSNASAYYAQSDRTKLIGEFQSGDAIIIIGDKESFQSIGVLEDVFVDCTEIFPDDPYAEPLGYRLAGTDFMEIIGCESVDDSDLYVAFRKPQKTMGASEEKMQTNYDHAVAFWKNFIAKHRVDGLTLEPTAEPAPVATDEYGY